MRYILAVALVVVSFQLSCTHFGEKQPDGLAIMQGWTDKTATQIVVLRNKKQTLSYSIVVSGAQPDSAPMSLTTHSNEKSKWVLDTLTIRGMKLNENYKLKITGPKNQLIDERLFSGLNTHKPEFRAVIASCMQDFFDPLLIDKIWSDVISQAVDLLFLIGDNSYTTSPVPPHYANPHSYWKRMVETRQKLKIFKNKRLIPILATWDDHDYGMNNGNSSFEHKDSHLKTFRLFFGMNLESDAYQRGPGLAFNFKAYGPQFIFADNRYFRSAKGKQPQTHFGEEQENWIVKSLMKKRSAWLISGDQFFGGYHPFESYEGDHPQNFVEFQNKIKKTKAPFVLISGDRHLMELMKIPKKYFGFSTYELTTSGLHAKTYPGRWDTQPNPLHEIGFDLKQNFAVVEIKNNKWRVDANLKGYTLNNQLLFEKRLRIKR